MSAVDRVSVAAGRGLVAGAAATAAMTVASTAEMKLRGRPPSPAPAKVAAKLLGVKPEKARFAHVAHLSMGIGLGAVRGLIDLAGLRCASAAGVFFAVAWTPDLVVVPAAGAADPPWQWGFTETAISGFHHLVYAAAGEAAYRALSA